MIAMASIDVQHMFIKLKDMDAIFYMSIQSLISCCRLISYSILLICNSLLSMHM